ncbi:MAG: NADH:ubiquinone reductase (Na(+)-transporting) subunit B [Bacteroidetes bacterium GWE2_41_25]|nr:MAG: NADH:ubiquinone reductase (Na(+)-transporting) subunit B [Bacteroidetes bacterium GWA2_40_15]OFX90983.1 MAG: NADH:ubiquinone reductase (Na(+)-transporting) subunit B [Bacteroidetes bacterium GWC2_40_22]OFY11402.1 MAG: NADH:ubiquinone reductase (Na(+)-transporting) subunit B [Bacteroidetes bacterium GWE2_41_25]OFY61804.1 MAG: NADH:ubiquinone reductase (Na(+)-transporting) subunit B [Bacteroidetes bacterium GWF2_41_9]HAM09312.1 NADH:ubiquinone reductase (Na(+)-transporting) subunit B [Bac
MDSLRKKIDKIKPNFMEGGRFAKLRSVFEGFESFLFVSDKVTFRGSHIRDSIDLKRTMTVVIIALLPAFLFGAYNIGLQHFRSIGTDPGLVQMFLFGFLKMLPLVIVSYGVGLGIEFIAAQIRGHEINEGFLVSGLLIPLVMPVDVPLWMLALATAFAVILGKEIFGGTGMNIFNPALLARAFLFFSYPAWMSGDKVWIEGLVKGENIIDGFSGATPLAMLAQGEASEMPSFMDMFIGTIPGSIGETSTLAILIGAVILIATGIGSWKIIISTFAGGLAMGLLLNVFAANDFMELPAYYHMVLGGFAFGAVFMATDPVSGAQTETGKWIYGFLIGILSILIRVLNPAYPEGVMLAILLMNVFAPLIDYYVVRSSIKRRLKRAETAFKNQVK